MRIVIIRLKGPYAPSGKDWDRAVLENSNSVGVTVADNEYGLNRRTYPIGNIERVDYTGHW